MKRISFGILVLITILGFVVLLRGPQTARAQGGQQQDGWLEGTVRNENGKPTHCGIWYSLNGKDFALAFPDGAMAETYSLRNITPGIYEIHVSTDGYRPQRIFGVVVKPGVRSILNFTLHEGKEPEDLNQPNVPTQKVLIISEELAKLQQQIDDLKKK